jgi:hypothetical protein
MGPPYHSYYRKGRCLAHLSYVSPYKPPVIGIRGKKSSLRIHTNRVKIFCQALAFYSYRQLRVYEALPQAVLGTYALLCEELHSRKLRTRVLKLQAILIKLFAIRD